MHSCSLGMYSRGPTTLSATSGLSSRTVTGVRISSSGAIWLTSLHLKIQFGSESNIDPIALPPPICFWKVAWSIFTLQGPIALRAVLSISQFAEPLRPQLHPTTTTIFYSRAPEGTWPTSRRLLRIRFFLVTTIIAKEALPGRLHLQAQHRCSHSPRWLQQPATTPAQASHSRPSRATPHPAGSRGCRDTHCGATCKCCASGGDKQMSQSTQPGRR